MFDVFQGDPKISIDGDGADLKFRGGQPVMDQGLENLALICLFTRPGWCGNSLLDDPAQQVGSDFEDACNQPITLKALNDIKDAAEKALANPKFNSVQVEVTNPKSALVRVEILIGSNKGEEKITLEKSGQAWVLQRDNPAHMRL